MADEAKAAQDVRPTKTRILDAAEELFAARGFYGVSLREITQVARVELALASYHFGPKDKLFTHVISRRANEHVAGVLAALDKERETAANGIASVERIIYAFCSYTFRQSASGDSGWKCYFQLLARSAVSPAYEPFLAPLNSLYGSIVRRYQQALQAALPSIPPGNLYTGYYFLQAMVSRMLAETGLLDRQSRGACRAGDFEAHLARIVPFAAAGFYALANCDPAFEGAQREIAPL